MRKSNLFLAVKVIILLVVMNDVLASQIKKNAANTPLPEALEKIEQLKKEIEKSTDKQDYIRRMQHLLVSYSQYATHLDESGETGNAYEILQEAYIFELTARSLGQKETTISEQLTSLKSRILFVDVIIPVFMDTQTHESTSIPGGIIKYKRGWFLSLSRLVQIIISGAVVAVIGNVFYRRFTSKKVQPNRINRYPIL